MFSVGGQETNPTGTAISSDGTKMYVIGAGNDTVYQYSTGL
jgi:DNA-binding beta-propeller fold protein YncE